MTNYYLASHLPELLREENKQRQGKHTLCGETQISPSLDLFGLKIGSLPTLENLIYLN